MRKSYSKRFKIVVALEAMVWGVSTMSNQLDLDRRLISKWKRRVETQYFPAVTKMEEADILGMIDLLDLI